MYISRLFVKNFRNLRHLDVEILPGVTCFIGETNSGKTNIFHAVRLVLDGNISAQRRRLQPEDLAAGLKFTTPGHVLVSVELSDFAGKPNEEALPFTAVLANGNPPYMVLVIEAVPPPLPSKQFRRPFISEPEFQ
jgi:putative ATP-dependent endonuclease of OLD family